MEHNRLHHLFEEAKNLIRESDRILLAGHANPDGDSLGSLLALSRAIRENLGKETKPYMADEKVPDSLDFLPGIEELNDDAPWFPELIIGVDYGDFERLGLSEEIIKDARIITFDHHPESAQAGDIKIIDIGFSSTAELVYAFLNYAGWHISPRTATCLLTGIFTDTGGFAHNTFAYTFKAAGELIQLGAELNTIYFKTISGKSAKVLNVWGKLLEKSELDNTYGFNGAFVGFEEFKKYDIVLDDLTGFINMMNMANEANFAVLVVEYESGKIKGSFRSDKFKDVNVSKIAQQLGGGGHKYASGFDMECGIEEAKERVLQAIDEVLGKKV